MLFSGLSYFVLNNTVWKAIKYGTIQILVCQVQLYWFPFHTFNLQRKEIRSTQSSWHTSVTLRMCVLSLQSCPTLCDPMNCSLVGSSVHGILQARILEWVASPSAGALPHSRIKPTSPKSSSLAGIFFATEQTWGVPLCKDSSAWIQIPRCYSLNIWIPPKFVCGNPNTQCDDMRR